MFSIINNTSGNIYIKSFNYLDGQPHVRFDTSPNETKIIYGRITNSDDLLKLQLIVDILKRQELEVQLRLSYLMGGRMDRPISTNEPATLNVICKTINSLGFTRISLFDCHSIASQALLNAWNILPESQVQYALKQYDNPVVIIPDAGAEHRVNALVSHNYEKVQCLKTRSSSDQTLSETKIVMSDSLEGRECVIIDDICDGGRTFINIARVLKNNFLAKKVHLYVTHGIFSYGYNLDFIDDIYTTNSYRDMCDYPANIKVLGCEFAPIPEPKGIEKLKKRK